MIDISSGYRVARPRIYPIQAGAVMCNVCSTHYTAHGLSYITFYTRVQTFANIYKYSITKGSYKEERGCEKIIVALKKECWKRWNGAVSLII